MAAAGMLFDEARTSFDFWTVIIKAIRVTLVGLDELV